jgi:type VI secretion system secreted protein Hcp
MNIREKTAQFPLDPAGPSGQCPVTMKTIWLSVRPTLGWLAVAAVLIFPAFSLSGAVDMFLKIGDVKGESQDKEHAGEIDVLAWSWGMTQSGTTHIGGGGGAGISTVEDLSVTKWIDKSTPTLMLYLLQGNHFSEATLTIRPAGTTPLDYLKIVMKEVIVTGQSTGGSGGEDRLTENIKLNFAQFTLSYRVMNANGTPGEWVDAGWDIAKNTKM